MFSDRNNQAYRVSIHIIIWAFLLAFPFLFSTREVDFTARIFRYTWIPMLLYALLFYANLLYLTDRFFFNRKVVIFILINLVLVACCEWIYYEVKQFLTVYAPLADSRPRRTTMSLRIIIYKDTLSMLIPVTVAIALKAAGKWTSMELERKEAARESLSTELQSLRYQLQPHFFFNSLNTIYALIERSPAQAQETVHTLSKLMRYLLYTGQTDKVLLSEEIGFLQQYIDLMKLRVGDRISIKTVFPEATGSVQITPLLFISLIENAFKHGVSATRHSELYFNLSVFGNNLIFVAENSNFPKSEEDKSGSGIGLVNLKKRLDISYPGQYSFETKMRDDKFVAILEINIQ